MMNLVENKKLFFQGNKKYINELKVGDRFDSYARVLSISKKAKKDGGAFLILELMDKSGKLSAKAWDNAESYFKLVKEGSIYKITGATTEYQGQKEIKIDIIRAIASTDTDFDETDFVEKSSFDTGSVYSEMMKTIRDNISTTHIKQLVDLFEKEHGDKFKEHYGAQKIHHSYIGGLMQHTYSMIQLGIVCAKHYSLDIELLLIGILFHDIGKIYEFSVSPTVETTLEGGLLGHLLISNNKFIEMKNKIPGFPEDLSCKIQHLIISHHGEKEFGSPEVPKIPEAFVLNILDLLDSKLKIVEDIVSHSEVKGLFSDFVQVLNRRVYIPPKTK